MNDELPFDPVKELLDAQETTMPCRFRASFPTERSAAADTMPGWVPYHCPEHDCWHLRKTTTTESDPQ